MYVCMVSYCYSEGGGQYRIARIRRFGLKRIAGSGTLFWCVWFWIFGWLQLSQLSGVGGGVGCSCGSELHFSKMLIKSMANL